MPNITHPTTPPSVSPPTHWPSDAPPPLELLHAMEHHLSDNDLAHSAPLRRVNHHPTPIPSRNPTPRPSRCPSPSPSQEEILLPDGFHPRSAVHSTPALSSSPTTTTTTYNPPPTPHLRIKCVKAIGKIATCLASCITRPLKTCCPKLPSRFSRSRKSPLDDADGPLATLLHRSDSLLDGSSYGTMLGTPLGASLTTPTPTTTTTNATHLGIGSQQCSQRFREAQSTLDPEPYGYRVW